MSKACLQLILCSDDVESRPRVRRRERGVKLSVIDGGRRAVAVERTNPWEALLGVFDLTVLIAQANYAAFVAASLTAIELHIWTDPEQMN
jgi:hypothetical protein